MIYYFYYEYYLTFKMDKEMDRKLLDRFAKLMEEQTIEPTKKDVAAVVNKFYSEQKQNKKLAAGNALDNEPKKKRQPSDYNIFFQEQMAILKEKETEMEKEDRMTAKAKMQYVAALWKEKKGEDIIVDDEDN